MTEKDERLIRALSGNTPTGVEGGDTHPKTNDADEVAGIEEETTQFKQVTDEEVLPEMGSGNRDDVVSDVIHPDAD